MARNFAVSDLHGNYPLWNKVKEQLRPDDKLFFLGDAADRGLGGWDILKEALLDERVCYIRGNHDQFILDAWKANWDNVYLWFYNGGKVTYQAIMEDSVLEVEKILKKLNESPLYIEFNHRVYLSHAGWTFNGDLPSAKQLLWDRNHIRDETQFPEDIYMVHGHTSANSL